jgi:2'-5' RNA ligase
VRLFVAAEIGERLASRIGVLMDDVRARVAASAPHAKVTWVAVDRLHLTIRFIGEIEEGRVDVLRAAVRPPLPIEPFDLSLAGVGSFPKGGTPRVLWVGVADGVAALTSIERDVSGRLARIGIDDEERPYRPHLTLARVRDAAGLRSSTLLAGLADLPVGTARIDAITLFQSRLSPKGPTYVPLERIPFA